MSVFRLQFKLSLHNNTRPNFWLWGAGFGLLFSSIFFLLIFSNYYKNRYYQGIVVGNVDLGGLTTQEAAATLSQYKQPLPNDTKLIIQAFDINQQPHQATLNLHEIVDELMIEEILETAFQVGRDGNFFERSYKIIDLLNNQESFILNYRLNEGLLKKQLQQLAQEINYSGKSPSLQLTISNNPQSIQLDPGEDGLELLQDESFQKILSTLEPYTTLPPNKTVSTQIVVDATTFPIIQKLSEDQAEKAQQRALAYVGRSVVFEPTPTSSLKNELVLLANTKQILGDQELVAFVNPTEGYYLNLIEETISTWAEEINQPPVNAEFEYDQDNLKATVFKPDEPGLELDEEAIRDSLLTHMKKIEPTSDLAMISEEDADPTKQLDLVIHQTKPEFTLAKTNDLGIKELIGFGESFYRGSIPTRLHNVNVASEKLSMTLIPPGEEFSFNQAVGKVDGSTGFQQAYVIRSGQTLMEFGGGVCQVSTTMFRAMLDAGVNITKRLPHSYRVSYYEIDNQPGFDATVYSGEVDLRFINDTPGYLLIVANAYPTQAYMTVHIYGTNDGRQSEIGGYRQWDFASPPPPEDVHDPSLAPGERKQVENAIPGLKTSFDWTVYDKDGNLLHEKTFFSHYRAWGAKYLVGI